MTGNLLNSSNLRGSFWPYSELLSVCYAYCQHTQEQLLTTAAAWCDMNSYAHQEAEQNLKGKVCRMGSLSGVWNLHYSWKSRQHTHVQSYAQAQERAEKAPPLNLCCLSAWSRQEEGLRQNC